MNALVVVNLVLDAVPELVQPGWLKRVCALVDELDARLRNAEPSIMRKADFWDIR